MAAILRFAAAFEADLEGIFAKVMFETREFLSHGLESSAISAKSENSVHQFRGKILRFTVTVCFSY